MLFAKAFLDLQFTFAERVAHLAGIPLRCALLDYTNIYVRLGLGRCFDSEQARWQMYLSGLAANADGRDWTYQRYLQNAEANTSPAVEAAFGCFSYAILDSGDAKLHFRNAETGAVSPLSDARCQRRRAELTALFDNLKRTRGSELMVTGSSWLYNLNAYNRLFPRQYSFSAKVIRSRFQSMSLWGQFVDHQGQLKDEASIPFLQTLVECRSLNDLDCCFPFQAVGVRAPAQTFYDFFGI